MRPVRIALLALLALAAAPAAHAQAPAGETATEAAGAAQAGAPVQPAAPAADAQPAGTSLPRYTPPRTLRAYAHVFAAFAVAWVLLFGYVVFVARKFRRVEEQVAALARS
ncbi:MAG TPA: CcmD family protein [Longimicrobium sp.]